MIVSPPTPPEWTSQDAQLLKEFLATSTGQRMQATVAFVCPAYTDGSDANKALVAMGKRAGYEEAFATLFSLTTIQPEQPEVLRREAYPSLDDEAKWEDAPKTPNTKK